MIDNKKINFFTCHLGWWNDEDEPFKNQVDNLMNKVDGLSFIMGDFNNNAMIRNEGYDYLISKGLIDTYNIALEKDNGITVRAMHVMEVLHLIRVADARSKGAEGPQVPDGEIMRELLFRIMH